MEKALVLIVIFFVTSAIGVVTGSNSLIAVPVMFQVGIEPRVAVATNMFALVFMAVGGAIPFARKGQIDTGSIWRLSLITVAASVTGAVLAAISGDLGIKTVVTAAMLFVAIFSLAYKDRDGASTAASAKRPVLLLLLTGVLGIYGGYFSGGYVTMLTAAFVAVGGMNYHAAVGTTKVVNIFSSLAATIVFAIYGLIDYSLGLMLGVTMFVGAYIGGVIATRMDAPLLKKIFLGAVLLLALKTAFDLLQQIS